MRVRLSIASILYVAFFTSVFLSACAGRSEFSEAQPDSSQRASSEATTSPPDNGSCHASLVQHSKDEDAIREVLNGEGSYVVAQDIDLLMKLWADDSLIADAKNTPERDDDDQKWQGKDAIRHRYVRIVFPGAPSVAKPSNLDIKIDGEEAVVMATTNIGDEISPHGDEWRLINNDGCWLIKSLTYNLEKK